MRGARAQMAADHGRRCNAGATEIRPQVVHGHVLLTSPVGLCREETSAPVFERNGWPSRAVVNQGPISPRRRRLLRTSGASRYTAREETHMGAFAFPVIFCSLAWLLGRLLFAAFF